MCLKKHFNKLQFIFFISMFSLIIPINTFAYSDKIILGGESIGINVNSIGVMVVGFYDVNGISPGSDAGFEIGDVIIKIDDKFVSTIDDLSDIINKKTSLNITYLRRNEQKTATLNVILDNNTYKTGLYIKDKIVGIGTLSFIDPETHMYGALGHEIKDSISNMKFNLKNGDIYKSYVTGIVRSEINSPGEKNASFKEVIGTVTKNHKTGIYGYYNATLSNQLIQVSNPDKVHKGEALIRTTIDGDKPNNYKIEIIGIYEDETKNILFKVTDEELIKKTNGIIQGMSGSPIIQDEQIIGVVNYVVIDNPLKGYGIFITNMLKEIEQKEA